MNEQHIIERLLAQADIQINGSRPADIQVHNPAFYGRVLSQGSLGLGESYMAGWWDCPALDKFFYRLLRSPLSQRVTLNPHLVFFYLKNKLFNTQSKFRAFALKHYDTGNDLYQAMLDKRLVYTCGYWDNATNLDLAQEAKLDLVCRKVGLKPGMKVLDIGCGWGSFMKYAAEKYGVSCVGVTISPAQVELGRQRCQGLPIEFRLQDYRDLNEPFDMIVSLGMFEHVGPKNYRTYMTVVRRCLKNDGLFLLHTIGRNTSSKTNTSDPWINKYIFPGGVLPSIAQIGRSVENIFVMEDWHNFGVSYDKTLMAWHENFTTAWPQLKTRYDEIFFRMWQYYLLSCAGAFRARSIQLWQIVLSKHGLIGGYESIR